MRILADTSVWIDFFKGIDSRENEMLKRCIAERENLFLTPIVVQEILQGIKSDEHYKSIKHYLLLFPLIESDLSIHVFGAEIYRDLRKIGITISSTIDCLIAALAMRNDLFLLHKNRDFDRIAKNKPLKVLNKIK